MKLPLSSGLLSAASVAVSAPAAPGASGGRFVMRVDRTFDRKSQPALPNEEIPAESYREGAPADRWEVSIEGSLVVLTELGRGTGVASRLEGHEHERESSSGVRRFDIGAGNLDPSGVFVLRGDEAELTIFGPHAPPGSPGMSVPIVQSERGKLLTAR